MLELNALKQYSKTKLFPAIAIDWGKRRIGIAYSDRMGLVSTPLKLIEKTPKRTTEDIIKEIQQIISEFQIKTVVVGIPETNPKTAQAIKEFTSKLEPHLENTNIILWDESFSTTEAQNMLTSSGRRLKKNKKKLDALAASVFLQEFLNYVSRIK